MSSTTDLVSAAAQIKADSNVFHAWLRGPATGEGSLVDFGGGLTLKTPARMQAENEVYETVVALEIDAGAVSVDLSQGGVFTLALAADVTGMTFAGLPAGTFATSFILETIGDGTARAFAEPGSVVAMNGDWTPTSADGKRDRAVYETIDGGATWRRSVAFQNF